jgi:hypothetical protein
MQENVQSQGPSLGVQDLLLMYQIIQVVSQRGAIRADEMANVGGLHDRLRAFLEASGVIKSSVQTAEEAPTQSNTMPPVEDQVSKEKSNAKTRRKT